MEPSTTEPSLTSCKHLLGKQYSNLQDVKWPIFFSHLRSQKPAIFCCYYTETQGRLLYQCNNSSSGNTRGKCLLKNSFNADKAIWTNTSITVQPAIRLLPWYLIIIRYLARLSSFTMKKRKYYIEWLRQQPFNSEIQHQISTCQIWKFSCEDCFTPNPPNIHWEECSSKKPGFKILLLIRASISMLQFYMNTAGILDSKAK